MQSKELRVGNLVYMFGIKTIDSILKTPTGNYKVELNEKRKNGISVSEMCLINSLELEPILTTEEWLLKFGFYKLTPIKSEHWYIIRYGLQLDLCMQPYWFEFHFPKSGYQQTSEHEIILKSHVNNDNQIKIKWGEIHIHELQNLYFALTGEELELKSESKP